MMYNISSGDSVDIDRVKECWSKISNINLNAIRVRRFSKPSKKGAHPPILVCFDSSFEASRVLKNSKLLPTPITVTTDRTSYQRNQYKKLKEIATQHNKSNPTSLKTVKYINGTPSLIDSKNHQNESTSSQTATKN